MTAAELRAALAERDLETCGKKAELVARYEEALRLDSKRDVPEDEGDCDTDAADEAEAEEDGSCFCGQPEREPTSGWWVQCDKCERWCHGECSGLGAEPADDAEWTCRKCVGGALHQKLMRTMGAGPARAVGAGTSDEDVGPTLTAAQEAALETDGLVLLPVVRASAGGSASDDEWRSLEALLETDGAQLGRGRDVGGCGAYDRLSLARAWRCEIPMRRTKYQCSLVEVAQELDRIGKAVKLSAQPRGMPVRTAKAAAGLRLGGGGLHAPANEALLLHGTPADRVLSMLSTGMNERFSGSNAGTAFGDGVYLAEDAGKTDQYVQPDAELHARAKEPLADLHRRLYAPDHAHPGSVYYVFVCRVALGARASAQSWWWRWSSWWLRSRSRPAHACPPLRAGHSMRTLDSGRDARSMDTNEKKFPVSFRELAPVNGVPTPTMHHSLIAELGGTGAPPPQA